LMAWAPPAVMAAAERLSEVLRRNGTE